MFNIQLVAGGLTLPVAGWLADIYFGRINWSVWTIWTTFMLVTASTIIAQFVDTCEWSLDGCRAIGLGGFQAIITDSFILE